MNTVTVLLCVLSFLCVLSLILQIVLFTRRKGDSGQLQYQREKEINNLLTSSLNDFRSSIESRFDAMDLKNSQFRESQLQALERIRLDNARQMEAVLKRSDILTQTLERNMQNLRKENNEQIDRMRKTVDEQLKDTLESRLTQSFEQVQKQLESVYKGLGEMQNLAKNVGDLSRIFANVKTRGVWGELQAESILDDILTKDQYVVLAEARDISEKYIAPPRTTDFAILFLPSESIYAEILSIPGFSDELQTKYRVTVAGPTTLAALVNSLQMGFRTLAVEKRSHEVWKLFSQMKKQFSLFASSVDAAGRSLTSAVTRIEDVSTRTARISQKLDSIELPQDEEGTRQDLLE